MSDVDASFSCRIVWPSVQAWKSALSVHLGVLLFVLLPVALLLYKLALGYKRFAATLIGCAIGTMVPLTVDAALQHNVRWMSLFLWATFGFHAFFKCIAVAQYYYPPSWDLRTFVFWFTSLPEPMIDKQDRLVSARPGELREHLKLVLVKTISTCALLSVLLADIDPIQAFILPNKDDRWMNYIGYLLDAWVHLWWIYLFASFCMDFGALLVKLAGYTTEPTFDNPLVSSRSYREFWSIKWDKPVHVFLKRSIYKPLLQRQYSTRTASLAVFLASGLLHEYNFYTHNHDAHVTGHALLFFGVLGTCMLVEAALLQAKYNVSRRIPSPILSIMLTIPLLPAFEVWFFQSWIQAGMLDSVKHLFPHVVCRKE